MSNDQLNVVIELAPLRAIKGHFASLRESAIIIK